MSLLTIRLTNAPLYMPVSTKAQMQMQSALLSAITGLSPAQPPNLVMIQLADRPMAHPVSYTTRGPPPESPSRNRPFAEAMA